MKTNIFLVRHAQSTYTPDELNRPLSEKGLRDAEVINEVLLAENINYVFSSPYKRAIQTVEGAAKNIKTEVIIEEGFKERRIAEESVDDFDNAMIKLWTNYDFSFNGGESNFQAQKRGVKSINKILDEYKGNNIVIGTHGNIMVLIMNYFDSKYDYEFWKNLAMPDVYKLSFQDNKVIKIERIWSDRNKK